MKRHSIIPYFLLAFLTVVILLVGLGVGIALSFSLQTTNFLDFKKTIGIVDFISGADMLFSVFFFMLYFISLGIYHILNGFNQNTFLITQITIYVIIVGMILYLKPFLVYLDIKSSFMIFSLVVYAIPLKINLDIFKQDNQFESSIDLVFYNFYQSLKTTSVVLFLLFISGWSNPLNVEILKVFLLTYLFSFFCILAGTLPFFSLNKMYYHVES